MSKHDWPKIEAEYRMGQKSVREIGREFGVSEGAVRKHMAKRGIQQDLSDQVRAVAAAEVIAAEVRKSTQEVRSASDAIQIAGQVAAVIEMKQRGRLAKLSQMAADLQEVALDDGMTDLEKQRAQAARLSMLIDVEAKLTPLERKVYRLDENEGSETSVEAWLKSQQTAT